MRRFVSALALMFVLIHTATAARAAVIEITYDVSGGSFAGAPLASTVIGGTVVVMFPNLSATGPSHTAYPYIYRMTLTGVRPSVNAGLPYKAFSLAASPHLTGNTGGVHAVSHHASGSAVPTLVMFRGIGTVNLAVGSWWVNGGGVSSPASGEVNGRWAGGNFYFKATWSGAEVNRFISSVPEPGPTHLLAAAFIGFGGYAATRRRRKVASVEPPLTD